MLTLIIGQNVEEAKLAGSHGLISLLRPVTIPCRECRREMTVLPETLAAHQGRPIWPVCLGCIEAAIGRLGDIDEDSRRRALELSRAYRDEIERRRGAAPDPLFDHDGTDPGGLSRCRGDLPGDGPGE